MPNNVNSRCYIINFIVHVSSRLLQSSVSHIQYIYNSPSHSFYLPQSISFTFIIFDCTYISWSFNLIVTFTFRPIPSLEVIILGVSFDKVLIIDRYSLFEVKLQWLYCSLCRYSKQKRQHGVRRNFLAILATYVYLLIYSTRGIYLGKQ